MILSDTLKRIAAGRTDLVLDLDLEVVLAATEDSDHASPLQWCAYYGDVSAVKVLLQRGAPKAALGPDLGLTAAAFHNHWRLVAFLIETGADVCHTDIGTGETALHAALSREAGAAQRETVRVLLQAGADTSVKTVPGRDTGCFMRDARTRGETPLHRAAVFADVETIDLLLNAGAAKDMTDAYGDSPLAWASWARRPDPILRRLCFGMHRIHPERKSMQDNLVGGPLS